jgi:hypothetical protein
MRKKIGEVTIETGQLFLTDPCLLSGWQHGELEFDGHDLKARQGNSYGRLCLQPKESLMPGLRAAWLYGHSLAMASYPVYAELNSEGNVLSITVDFEGTRYQL